MDILEILKQSSKYFNCENYEGWFKDYEGEIKNIDHDEPWLTLMALYSLFGNQSNLGQPNVTDSFYSVLLNCGINESPSFEQVKSILLEKKFPEITSYREYLYELLQREKYHLYPDRRNKLNQRLKDKRESLEGNTNLDLQITCHNNNKIIYFFIESKYLSDISYQITYNPVRNQIIRNIDVMIDFALNNALNFSDVHFLLLTPKIFRTEKYGGGKKSVLNEFDPQKGRYYCSIMDYYKNPNIIKKALPHRKQISDSNWEVVSNNIGWITFEDIYAAANSYGTITPSEKELIKSFFSNRNLLP